MRGTGRNMTGGPANHDRWSCKPQTQEKYSTGTHQRESDAPRLLQRTESTANNLDRRLGQGFQTRLCHRCSYLYGVEMKLESRLKASSRVFFAFLAPRRAEVLQGALPPQGISTIYPFAPIISIRHLAILLRRCVTVGPAGPAMPLRTRGSHVLNIRPPLFRPTAIGSIR